MHRLRFYKSDISDKLRLVSLIVNMLVTVVSRDKGSGKDIQIAIE